MDARRRSFPTNSQQFVLFFSRLGRNQRISVVVGDFFGEHLANRACIMAEYASPLNARYFAVGRIIRSLAPPKSATTYTTTHTRSLAHSLTHLLTYSLTALLLWSCLQWQRVPRMSRWSWGRWPSTTWACTTARGLAGACWCRCSSYSGRCSSSTYVSEWVREGVSEWRSERCQIVKECVKLSK